MFLAQVQVQVQVQVPGAVQSLLWHRPGPAVAVYHGVPRAAAGAVAVYHGVPRAAAGASAGCPPERRPEPALRAAALPGTKRPRDQAAHKNQDKEKDLTEQTKDLADPIIFFGAARLSLLFKHMIPGPRGTKAADQQQQKPNSTRQASRHQDYGHACRTTCTVTGHHRASRKTLLSNIHLSSFQ